MVRYWKGAHTRHRLQYHLVWIPKYRKRVLIGKIAARLKCLLYEGCRINRWWIEVMSIQHDHVHILIRLKPKDSVAHCAHLLKEVTSRRIRQEFPELEEFLWGDDFWADGYFAESVGKVSELTIRKYIEEQQV